MRLPDRMLQSPQIPTGERLPSSTGVGETHIALSVHALFYSDQNAQRGFMGGRIYG